MLGMKSFTRGVCATAWAAVALAAPREVMPIFPVRNSTKPTPTATNPTCENRCSVEYPQLSAVQWIPEAQIIYTTKITVATVSVILTVGYNTTYEPSTQTIYGYVPPEYSLYSLGTDDQGTAVVTLPVPQADGMTIWSRLAYPTPYIDYSMEYHWTGVLQTHDKASISTCETATPEPANVPLRQHPEYMQRKGEPSPNEDDPYGADHKPVWVPIRDEPDKAFFDAAFPSESAFSYCESIRPSAPLPTQYELPKFITETTTVTTTRNTIGVIIQPSVTGWDDGKPTSTEKCCRIKSHAPHIQSTASGWDDGLKPQTPYEPPVETFSGEPVAERIESTATGFFDLPGNQPQAQQTENPKPPNNNNPSNNNAPPNSNGPPNNNAPPNSNRPPNNNRPPFLPEVIESLIANNPAFSTLPEQQADQLPGSPGPVPAPSPGPGPGQGQSPGPAPAPAPAAQITAATPVFTILPTVINGQPTTIPAFILPDSSATATIGQTVTINGQPTVLSAPPALFTMIPTTINGVATSTPAYIISGTSTATLGQTITLDGGQTTVLSAPDAVFTWVSTTLNGVPTSVPAYVISGTSTATIGQTVIIDGTTTVLSVPTSTDVSSAGFEAPAVTSMSFGPQATGAANTPEGAGAGTSNRIVSCSAIVLGLGAVVFAWL